MKLRCYCCGDELIPGEKIALVVNAHEEDEPVVDRVFTMKHAHALRVQDSQYVLVEVIS